MRSLCLIAALAAAPAVADEPSYYDEAGVIYLMSANANGLVLTSKYPVGIFRTDPAEELPGGGVSYGWHEARRVIYLGKDCDAASEEYGTGRWVMSSGSAGGFRVDFSSPQVVIDFPLQEVGLDLPWLTTCMDRNGN